ncbi:MAG: hypothetical protein COA65_00735 [Rhodospirillaceae bacterium]|nr:MAG: hypothetical protein COA65_00735 [Rhodospirillaceae bacterium]
MSGMKFFCKGEGTWQAWRGLKGTRIRRLVGTRESETIGAGVLTMEKQTIVSSNDFDEVIVVLDGQYRSRSEGVEYEANPGDVFWVPAGTEFELETETTATIFYARYPMDPKIGGEDEA